MKKAASILLAYCILIIQIGCTTTKYLSFQQVLEAKPLKNYLILHTPRSIYNIYDYTFTDEGLKGNLASVANDRKSGVHVYTNLNFDLKTGQNQSNYITIPKSNIGTITIPAINIGKTLMLAGSGIGAVILIMSIVAVGSVDFM